VKGTLAAVTYFRLSLRNLPAVIEENHKNPQSEPTWYLDWISHESIIGLLGCDAV